jgi:hypothetical protein
MEKLSACIITPRPVGKGQYHWTWQAVDGHKSSRCHFRYFYDCVVDARAHGCEVDITAVVAGLKTPRRTASEQAAEKLKAA